MASNAALFIDLDRCFGCRTCEVACALENRTGPVKGLIRVEEVCNGIGDEIPGSPQGRSWVPVVCQQCDDADCVAVCPSNALIRNESGIIIVDRETCIGCGSCEEACPFGAIFISSENGKAFKCDVCKNRTEEGLLPSCVQACPGRAISIELPLVETARGIKRIFSKGKVVYLARSNN